MRTSAKSSSSSSSDRPVIVIGAGLAGLSAACHLRGMGHAVTVLESGTVPGGRAGIDSVDGFTFDTGPTVLTMPDLIDDCFRALGADPREFVQYKAVDPMYRANFADGSAIHVRHGRAPMIEEITRVCGPDQAAAFERFCDWVTELYRLEMPNFIDRNFESPLSLLHPIAPAIDLLRSRAFGKLDSAVRRFFDDERLVRIFSFQAMYAGLAPQQALALYAVITYMDSVNGVFAPIGGMHAVPVALAQAATAHGVQFEYGRRVQRIVLEHGTSGPVRGVRTEDGEVFETDRVVCTADLPVAYRTMLPGIAAPRAARRGNYSPSALVWHLGVSGDLPPHAAHHNIHFGHDWNGAFAALLKDGTRMPDPSILVTIPTVDEPSMAPEGKHVLYVLEPVPNLDGKIDWITERGPARERLLGLLQQHGYPTDIEVERLVDPTSWEAQGMERGTPFALSHRFFQTGPFRPPNIERRAPGLFFAGSGTVPGVGVPMVIVSGKLAAERVTAATAR
jgi:phytoene desaturase